MNDDDTRLEAHLRTTLRAVAQATPRSITPYRERRPPSPLRGRAAGIAAALMVAGAASLVVLTRQSSDPPSGRTTVSPAPTAAPAITDASTTGPLLTTALPSNVRPLVAVGEPGWAVTTYSEFNEVPENETTAECAGCAIPRLVVAADGPVFTGAIFTAWVFDGPFERSADAFGTPVTIGDIEGWSDGSPAMSSLPTEKQLTRLAWPIGGGRSAFVEAYGLASETVVAMAASLTFESGEPAMPTPPAGFSVRASPTPVATEHVKLTFARGDQTVEVTAANAGIQGLLDWRNPGGGNPIVSGWDPLTLGGATIAFFNPNPGGPPTNGAVATWISGDWSFTVIGYQFASTDEFLSFLTGLRLVDATAFEASVTNAAIVPIQNWFDQ